MMIDHNVLLPSVPSTSEAEVWIANTQAIGVIYLQDEIR